jgi:hypothetical protein
MKTILNKYLNKSISILFGVFIFLFWGVLHPEYLNYQEQNQLFLFSGDYFVQRIILPGGLADWISEFLVQFYYYAWAGALVLALLFVALQRTILYQLPDRKTLVPQLASLLSVALLLWHMGDKEVLLSYTVSLLLVTGVAALMKKSRKWVLDILILPVMYWLAGPLTWVYLAFRVLIVNNWKVSLVFSIVFYMGQRILTDFLPQIPENEIMLGINYYRVPGVWHLLMFVIPVVVATLPFAFRIKRKNIALPVIALVAVALGFVDDAKHYDKDMCETLKLDMLVRQERWDDVIQRAEDYQVKNAVNSCYVNLSLAMRRQLAERMFSFYQSGESALILPSVRDNISNIGSAEAFFRLGMVNSCLRYFSDLQESILNRRKSGRFTQRIAECHIVNGKYAVAQKQLDLLKQTLFYRSWALEAEKYLGKEAMINAHAEWGRMRRFHFKQEYLFSYPDIEKMIGQLFADNTANKMALDYFMGGMLLKGDMQGFMNYLRFVESYGGYTVMPMGYQDAITYIKSQGEAYGTAYGNYAQRMMAANQNQ